MSQEDGYNYEPPFFLGIDLGGTNVKCGVVDSEGTRLLEKAVEVLTEAERGAEVTLRHEAAREAVQRCGLSWDQIDAIGLGSPGTMDLKAGILLEPVNLKGPGWLNYPICKRLNDELGKPIAFQNDANAAAYGEFWVGAGKEVESMVLFTLGTGIGCGIVVGGKILEGQHSHGAECGHIVIRMKLDESDEPRVCGCGRAGCLEAYASATALINRAQEGLDAGVQTALREHWARTPEEGRAKLIDDLHKEGDQFCWQLMRDTAYYLAVGATCLMHTIDPDMIVFSGGMIKGGPRLLEWIREDVRKLAFPLPAERTEIVYAKLGGDAGYIGAAGCAKLLQEGRLR